MDGYKCYELTNQAVISRSVTFNNQYASYHRTKRKTKQMFKKIICGCLLLLLASSTLKSQDSETRTLPVFNAITIESKSKISIQPGSEQSVTVESNDLSEVLTSVQNETLHINGKSSKLDITIPSLSTIDINGMGEVDVDGTFKNQTLTLRVSGNGKINMPVDADKLQVEINGNGKLNLEGNTDDLNVDISGTGKLNAEDLHVKNMKANISGMGKCRVDVTDDLEVNISGVGYVYYKTEPAHIVKQVSGVARLGNINAEDNDTTTVHLGNKKIVIIGGEERDEDNDHDEDADVDIDDHHDHKPKKACSHWMGVDLGFNNYFYGSGLNTALPNKYDFMELNTGKSVAVNLNFFAHDFKIYKRYVMFATGIGMTLNNYRFSSDSTLIPKINTVSVSNDTFSLSKNKLAVTYATIPLLLQFNTNPLYKKSFHIAIGTLLSYRIESHTKIIYSDNGDKKKVKKHDDFNLNPFRTEATVRLGYRGYTLFANYAFTELFNSSHGPTLHPFTIGVSLSNW